jgi:NAD+ synthase (glutamine-hydrolysing)
MMQIHIHQTHHTLGDFVAIEQTLKELLGQDPKPGIHVFSELYLTGYPLQDLCLQRPFIQECLWSMERINIWSQNEWKATDEVVALVGGLSYEFDRAGLPYKIRNALYVLRPGHPLEPVYEKKLLPNYDIFDEEKYFTAGERVGLLAFEGETLGLLICEDMWSSSFHTACPVSDLHDHCQKANLKLRGIINLSASPAFLGKHHKRIERAREISTLFGAPFVYVNKVGGEDEILFDGRSFALSPEDVIFEAQSFVPQSHSIELPPTFSPKPKVVMDPENTWEGLFRCAWDDVEGPQLPTLHTLSDEDCRELVENLSFGLQEYARKTGFTRFSVALSGGIDSGVVLALAKLALRPGQELEAVYMPGLFSSPESWELSEALCKRLGVRLRHFPIKFTHMALRNAFRECFGEEMQGLSDENIQSRLRGSLIYARSNQWNSLVINTSNKSEIAVGYSTLYGDSVGALSLLGDLYKTEVFELARYLSRAYDDLIPLGMIERPPSAELKENQYDQQSLPPYERLDVILDGLLSYRFGLEELVKLGFDLAEVEKVYGLYQKSEYKRKQFCPIIKVKAKSFGTGYRVPICKTLYPQRR